MIDESGKVMENCRKSSLTELSSPIKINSQSLAKCSTDVDITNFKPIISKSGKFKSVDIGQLSSGTSKEKKTIEELSLQRWSDQLAKNQSIVTDTMMGQYLSKLECTVCKTSGYNFEPFYILELPIPSGIDQITLSKLLDHAAKPDLVEEFNWDCPKCNKPRQVTRTRYIYKLPKVLAVCFKRFELRDGRTQKNSCLVTTELSGEDLGKFEKGTDSEASKMYTPYMIIVICTLYSITTVALMKVTITARTSTIRNGQSLMTHRCECLKTHLL